MTYFTHIASPDVHINQPGLFARTGVRYEVACDVMGAVIAHQAEVIGQERERDQPDQAVLQNALQQKRQLMDARDALEPNDSAAIEAAIARYAPLARKLYSEDIL